MFTCARKADKLAELLDYCKQQGWDVQGVQADVAEVEAREQLMQAASQAFGGVLHVLVGDAAGLLLRPLESLRWCALARSLPSAASFWPCPYPPLAAG